MQRSEVIAALEQYAPVAFDRQGVSFGGGYQELAWLKICLYPSNDVYYLINYSGNDRMMQVIPHYYD